MKIPKQRSSGDDTPQQDHFQVAITTFHNLCFKQIAF